MAVFLIKTPPESDISSMMPLVSPTDDIDSDDQDGDSLNNFLAAERREESSPLVDLEGNGGKLCPSIFDVLMYL